MGGDGGVIVGASHSGRLLLFWSLLSHAEGVSRLQPSSAQHSGLRQGFGNLCCRVARTCCGRHTRVGILGSRLHPELRGLWCALACAQWQNCTSTILDGTNLTFKEIHVFKLFFLEKKKTNPVVFRSLCCCCRSETKLSPPHSL